MAARTSNTIRKIPAKGQRRSKKGSKAKSEEVVLKASKVTKAFRLRYKFKPGTVPHFRLFSSSSRQRYQVSVLSLSIPCSVKQSTKPNKTTGLRGLYTGKMKCLPESGCKPDNKESRSLNSNTWSLIPATKKRPLVGFRVRV